ncbi:hypothetical protein CPB84DRAFT_1750373 [Gymnopilus junonius]|uniref:F-box domain-containing protein n=1 Tax=Gymnopilus junonius TaxID=109634 RepID=A0A9P5TK37_GYMJU|nr:hypothetical protein CPB84DRAFT_1750373 [Gymnopilus junonius]
MNKGIFWVACPWAFPGLMPIQDSLFNFPPEIIDKFINHLPSSFVGDLTTSNARNMLLSCCLVSKDFSSTARRRLWSTIKLGSPKPTYDRKFSEEHLIDDFSQRVRGLTELLTSPALDLSLIVQELIITLGLVYFLSPDLKRLLSVIESRASNLKTLHLERVPWNTIPLDISRSLINLAWIPSLVNLELEWMENTPEDLVRRSLRTLSLRLFKVEFAPPDAFAGSSMSLLRLGQYLSNTVKYGFVESDCTLRGLASPTWNRLNNDVALG